MVENPIFQIYLYYKTTNNFTVIFFCKVNSDIINGKIITISQYIELPKM